jgi:hypothetical protein
MAAKFTILMAAGAVAQPIYGKLQISNAQSLNDRIFAGSKRAMAFFQGTMTDWN